VTRADALRGKARRIRIIIIRNLLIIPPKSRLSGARYKTCDFSGRMCRIQFFICTCLYFPLFRVQSKQVKMLIKNRE